MLVICPFLYHDCDGPASSPVFVSVSLFSVLGLFSTTPSSCKLVSSILVSSSPLASSFLYFCASSLSHASISYLLDWISAAVSPSSNSGTLSVGTSIFLTLRTHCQIISRVFVKNKILKYKVSQLQLNTKQTPILKKLPDVICQMPDSKWCFAKVDSPYTDRDFISRQAVGRKNEASFSYTVPSLSVV